MPHLSSLSGDRLPIQAGKVYLINSVILHLESAVDVFYLSIENQGQVLSVNLQYHRWQNQLSWE